MIIRSKAPLRLGFAGGGTDVSPYCDQFGGAIMNGTIDMYAYCTIEPLKAKEVEFIALDRDEVFNGSAEEPLAIDGLLDLHKGVYNRIVKKYNNGRPLPCRITTHSDAPAGSGLGSSSTLVVAILTAFSEWLNLPLGEYEIAHLAFEIERIDVGLSGGRQDQYAAAFGGFNFMEFYENERVIVNPLRVKNWISNELNASMLLYYTGVSRESANIIDEQVKRVEQGNEDSLAATHQLKSDAFEMKEALLRGEIKKFAQVLGKSWEIKQKIASQISNPHIQEIMARAIQAGAYSGKVSGAGGGGFIMFMVDPVKRIKLIKELEKQQEGRVMNFHFERKGVQAWRV